MSTIVLYDESGNPLRFQVLDVFGMDDQDYAVLLPETDPEASTYILRIEQDENGEPVFVGIDDDDELDEAIEIYEELKRESLQ